MLDRTLDDEIRIRTAGPFHFRANPGIGRMQHVLLKPRPIALDPFGEHRDPRAIDIIVRTVDPFHIRAEPAGARKIKL